MGKGRRYYPIWKLVVTDAAAAAEAIVKLYVSNECSISAAALEIGCTRWTLKRWIRALCLRPQLEEIKKRVRAEAWRISAASAPPPPS